MDLRYDLRSFNMDLPLVKIHKSVLGTVLPPPTARRFTLIYSIQNISIISKMRINTVLLAFF